MSFAQVSLIMISWSWDSVANSIVLVVIVVFYLFRKIFKSKDRLKKDFKELFDKDVSIEDAEALFDLIAFIVECVTTLGGVQNVRNVLEQAVGDKNGRED